MLAAWLLIAPASSRAGKMSWLDDVVRDVIAEARTGTKTLDAGSKVSRAEIRGAGRIFVGHQADEGLEQLIRGSDELARAGRKIEQPSEVLLQARFSRLLEGDSPALRSFTSLAPAEKRLVVEMGEAAQRLARRYPQEAEAMVRQLGPEGLSAVRVFGDDVAEVIVREGPESLGVLRKTGRGGWAFFTGQVLPHKKKLVAAGVLAAFLADPDRFVDYAGQATEFAVREFARAGIALTSALGSGVARGIESSLGEFLSAHGLGQPIFRHVGMALAALVALGSLLVVIGLPVRLLFRPLTWPAKLFWPRRRPI